VAGTERNSHEIRFHPLIAADIKAMVGFFEMVTGRSAEWLAPQFAEIVTQFATLAIGSAETMALFKTGSAEPAANRTSIIGSWSPTSMPSERIANSVGSGRRRSRRRFNIVARAAGIPFPSQNEPSTNKGEGARQRRA
jgi:hypothetical protein